MNLKLFSKREIFFRGLELSGVNLDQVARVVAKELGLSENEVIVVDAREDLLTVDVLNEEVEIERVAGKGKALLQALSLIPGLKVSPHAGIHSEGVLGLINLGAENVEKLPAAVTAIEQKIRANVAHRAVVLPTGSEIIAGQVADTNTPFLIDLLQSEGFTAEAGPAVADDVNIAIGALTEAGLKGYGLVVTTGGTGAEIKDCVIEAIEALDPTAATPYVVRYTRGQGRHHKDGVRLAVGCLELTTYVALTGPNREVRMVAPVLMRGLREGWSKVRLSEEMANVLRAELASQKGHHSG